MRDTIFVAEGNYPGFYWAFTPVLKALNEGFTPFTPDFVGDTPFFRVSMVGGMEEV